MTTDFPGRKASENRVRDSLSMSSDSDASRDTVKKMARKKIMNRLKPSKKKGSLRDADNTNNVLTAAKTCVNSDGAPPREKSVDRPAPSNYLGKRKRRIPKSIGGGKGDLQPPSKIQKGLSPTPTSQATTVTNNGELSTEATNKEEKRVLRSQAAPKEGRYEEFFRKIDEFDYELQMKIIKTRLPPDKKFTPYFPPNPPTLASPPTEEDLEEKAKQEKVDKIRQIPVETVDLEAELLKLNPDALNDLTKDPLPDELYKAPHLGQGKLERRIRNVEREKLAHNAQQLRQDIDKLHSPDWIKLLGISAVSVTALSKSELEERRNELIEQLEATVDKHRQWEEAERKKKQKSSPSSPKDSLDRDTAEAEDPNDDSQISHDPWDEINSKSRQKKRDRSEVEPGTEFTSFYDSPLARMQALSTEGRKSSRNKTAFGQPLPVFEQRDYELPEEIIASSGVTRAARARRRLSRE
ncbi:something about silencing, SAS, complex subunit 4-domain-containing protein [Geopyxis carbonaria]|nr:something about silencing, SAS, complex subunit 4-domain-containing protein [Geopyxis carbonaria]